MGVCLGLDTSNYTTSVALFDGENGENLGQLLQVPQGTLGLRQSDALFQHVKQLPLLMEQIMATVGESEILAVGASTKPRWVADSYMPCFLAGESLGRSLAAAMQVPFYPCSHQQGHVAAAAWSAGHAELLDTPHLAWHLSGGTTELLLVRPDGHRVVCECLGQTSDISAGQLIDRTGKLLGLAFPAGKKLDELAIEFGKTKPFPVKVNGRTFSLSGMENQVKKRMDQGDAPGEVAAFVMGTVAEVVARITGEVAKEYPGLPILCSGGVASSRVLRQRLTDAYFAPPQYSTDNALGVAILAHRGRLAEEGAPCTLPQGSH